VKVAEDRRAGSLIENGTTGNSPRRSFRRRSKFSPLSPLTSYLSLIKPWPPVAVCEMGWKNRRCTYSLDNVGNSLWRSTLSVQRMEPLKRPAADCSLATRPTLHRGGHTSAECGDTVQLAVCSCNGQEKVRGESKSVTARAQTGRESSTQKGTGATEAFMSYALSKPFLGRPQNLYLFSSPARSQP
jgi:hypothetical protein